MAKSIIVKNKTGNGLGSGRGIAVFNRVVSEGLFEKHRLRKDLKEMKAQAMQKSKPGHK